VEVYRRYSLPSIFGQRCRKCKKGRIKCQVVQKHGGKHFRLSWRKSRAGLQQELRHSSFGTRIPICSRDCRDLCTRNPPPPLQILTFNSQFSQNPHKPPLVPPLDQIASLGSRFPSSSGPRNDIIADPLTPDSQKFGRESGKHTRLLPSRPGACPQIESACKTVQRECFKDPVVPI